jgi:DNA primase
MLPYAESTIEQLVQEIHLLEYVSDYIDLEKKGKDYFGICPFHNENTASFSITPEKNSWYCFGCGNGGTVIDFVMKYNKVSFVKAISILLDYADIDVSKLKCESETFQLFKKIAKLNMKANKAKDHMILLPDTMDTYEFSGLDIWKKEGISDSVMNKYQVRFDRNAGRIVYPIHDIDGNLINVKGRIISCNWKERKLRKYTYYYPLEQSDFLFGLYQNKKAILDADEVIVFESAKSVMKMETNNVHNCVSLETSHFTDDQIKLLLSLQVHDIILALDNDIPLVDIKKDVKMLTKMTNVYVIKDSKKRLGEKDSPCDKGFELWKELYKERIKI